MIILAIDPGSVKTGYAVIDATSKKLRLLNSGTIRLAGDGESFASRLLKLHLSIESICQQFNPTQLALETLIHVKNVSSLAKLAQARGIIIATAMRVSSVDVHEYAPNLIKQTVAGHGHADKPMIQKAVQIYFGKLQFKTDDESDAIAIGMTHAIFKQSKLLTLHHQQQRGVNL